MNNSKEDLYHSETDSHWVIVCAEYHTKKLYKDENDPFYNVAPSPQLEIGVGGLSRNIWQS